MSHFNAILLAILSFGSSSLLMGMDSCLPWGKKPFKNYLSEDIEKLMLFNMQEADLKGVAVPQDVKNIIVRDGYKLYYDQLLKDESSWLNEHGGYADNFDFMTMNAEGRNFFKLLQQQNYFSREQYNGIIKLPMGLKREKSSVSVSTKDDILYQYSDSIGTGLTCVGFFTGGVMADYMPLLPKVCTMAVVGLGLCAATTGTDKIRKIHISDGCLILGGAVAGGIILQQIPVVPALCSMFAGGVACPLMFEMTKDQNGMKYGFIKKSLFSKEEQRMIAIQKQVKFDRLEADKPDWFKKLNWE